MFYRLSQLFFRRYSPYWMIFLLLISGGFFWLFNFSQLSVPISNLQLVKISGGNGLLDLKLFYGAQDAYDALTHYGEEGRALYKRFLKADFLFTFCYGFGFAMLLTCLLKSLNWSKSNWILLNLLPLAVALADCFENLSIFTMLAYYPEKMPITGLLAGIFTSTKHLLTLLSLTSLLVLSVRFLITKTRSE